MEGLIQSIIANRMIALGWKNWYMKTNVITLDSDIPIIERRQNQYLFLIDIDDTTDPIFIIGDNNMIFTPNLNVFGYTVCTEDFTGDITIFKQNHTVTQKLVFVSVIPKE